jgi:hypothetical protein
LHSDPQRQDGGDSHHVDNGTNFPMIALVSMGPKYLPPNESRTLAISKKTSCRPSVRQPVQCGSARPWLSAASAVATAIPLIVTRALAANGIAGQCRDALYKGYISRAISAWSAFC